MEVGAEEYEAMERRMGRGVGVQTYKGRPGSECRTGPYKFNGDIKGARLPFDSSGAFSWNFLGVGAEYVTRVGPGRPNA